jgi:hypothetical protein
LPAKEPKPSSPCFGFTLFSACATCQSGERKELAIFNRSDSFFFTHLPSGVTHQNRREAEVVNSPPASNSQSRENTNIPKIKKGPK